MSSNLADEPSLAVLPPHLKLLDEKVTATHFHTINENPFETVNLLEKYKELPPSLAVLPPHLKLLDKKVTAMRFHTVNENPFETVNLLENIRKYQYI